MHYYQHSIGDYRRDTMHLTLLEHGVYRQLLDLYYLNECELDANALRLVCARSAEEIQAAESVLNEFFDKTQTGYKHKRCDAEIAKFHDKSAKAKASADARWSGKDNSINANALPTQCKGNANHKPITNNHTNENFEKFYSAYPKKKSKSAALKAWNKLNPPIEDVLKALAWQTKSHEWTKENGQFIQYPASYLNAGAWQDEPLNQQPSVRRVSL